MKKCLWLFLLFSFSAAAAELSQQVQEVRLANGMPWLLVYRPQAPVFSGVVMVRAGGVDEEKGKTGLAHMFEHMAFKGSPKIPAEKVWEILSRAGAVDLNAFTTKDVTAYHASLPVAAFSTWAFVTSEMVFHPTLNDFYPERDVVMEERRLRYDNSPHGFFLEKLIETAYPEGPYHSSPIGHAEDISRLTDKEAAAFHQKYYRPRNMVGVLVGALSKDQALPVLNRYFGQLPGGSLPKEPKQYAFAFQGEKRGTVKFRAEPYLAVGFYKPRAPAREDYIFDMLLELLCEGRTSRLNKKLIQEKKIAADIYCSANFPGSRQDNLFVFFASPLKGTSLNDLEAALLAELTRITQDLEEKELEKVRRSVLHDFLWNIEGSMNLAEELAMAETVLDGWQYVANYTKVIRSISKKEIQKTAEKYFVPENRVVMFRERGKS